MEKQASRLFLPPLESDKELEAEAFETSDREPKRYGELKDSGPKKTPRRPRKDSKVMTSTRKHLLFEKAERKRKKIEDMRGNKDRMRKIEEMREKLEGLNIQEDLVKMLIEEVSRKRVERKEMQESMERKDREWKE